MPIDDSLIPREKSDAVVQALRESFGATTFDDIQELTRGLSSALVYRIVVQGRAYLLRVIMRAEDPSRHFECMRAAADAGLAPRIHYTSVEDRICITDFVEAVPFPISDALVRLPAALRSLHTLPPFPTAPFNTTCTFLFDKGPALDGLIQKLRASQALPGEELQHLLRLCEQVTAAYPRDEPALAASHNDLFKADNILFDGQRVCLVDWEAAFLNDRYADLAVVANHVVTSDEDEEIYLRGYFGRHPSPYQRARFYLMQQVVHVFYAMVFLMLAARCSPHNPNEYAPDFRDLHRRMWAGELDLSDSHMKTLYGRAHWEQLLHNTWESRFDEAVRIVSARAS